MAKAENAAGESVDDASAIEKSEIIDYISGKPVRDDPKEKVRQRIARAIFHEHGLSVEDMARDFPIPGAGQGSGKARKRRVDIAIFSHGTKHELANLRRMVVCRPEPKSSRRNVVKLRDHEQASKDLDELKDLMAAVPSCQYGLWTDGLDLFYLHKKEGRFNPEFEPRADWPLADETMDSRSLDKAARLRRADPEMLKLTFRRCHNFIHGNEGMPKDAAFWQFLYLIFCKLLDEQTGPPYRFYALPMEPFNEEGRKAISARVLPLFDEVKKKYAGDKNTPLFRGNEEITLSPRALAFLVAELARYDFTHTELDAKGLAYQELVGHNLRGDRGQYFTPKRAVRLMVEILNPQPDERVFDPACGTGGFLVETLRYLEQRWLEQRRKASGKRVDPESEEISAALRKHLQVFAQGHLFGADFDPFLVRAASMNLMMAANTPGHIFHMDSLAFPRGHLTGVEPAKLRVPPGSVDVLMTNPPFGSDIPITDPQVLHEFRDGVAGVYRRNDAGKLVLDLGKRQSTVAPEVLFIQRSVEWLRPGGRLGIVLPDGILGNPGDEPVRQWILRHCYVLASVDLPVETFIHEADVNILTSLLFLKKKTLEEIKAEDLGQPKDYPLFMAVAEKVGIDRRGNPIFKRRPDGELILEKHVENERIRIGDKTIERHHETWDPVPDNDLPEIAKAYREFRQVHPEPGEPRP